MAFISMIIVGLLACCLAVGFFGAIVSTVCLIIFSRKKRQGSAICRTLATVSVIALVVCFVLLVIPIGFITFILALNTLPPEYFVETEIVIEENGYQDTRFTADGVVYECIDLYADGSDYFSAPIFSYKTEGFLKGAQCGNYYVVENPHSFSLVCDEFGLLFCPIDEKQRVRDYYANELNLCWYYNDTPLDPVASCALSNFLKDDSIYDDFFTVQLSAFSDIALTKRSIDGVVYIDEILILPYDASAYFVLETCLNAEDEIEYKVSGLPPNLESAILEFCKVTD